MKCTTSAPSSSSARRRITGRGDAVDVVVAVDRDPLTSLERSHDAIARATRMSASSSGSCRLIERGIEEASRACSGSQRPRWQSNRATIGATLQRSRQVRRRRRRRRLRVSQRGDWSRALLMRGSVVAALDRHHGGHGRRTEDTDPCCTRQHHRTGCSARHTRFTSRLGAGLLEKPYQACMCHELHSPWSGVRTPKAPFQ